MKFTNTATSITMMHLESEYADEDIVVPMILF